MNTHRFETRCSNINLLCSVKWFECSVKIVFLDSRPTVWRGPYFNGVHGDFEIQCSIAQTHNYIGTKEENHCRILGTIQKRKFSFLTNIVFFSKFCQKSLITFSPDNKKCLQNSVEVHFCLCLAISYSLEVIVWFHFDFCEWKVKVHKNLGHRFNRYNKHNLEFFSKTFVFLKKTHWTCASSKCRIKTQSSVSCRE